MSVKLGYCLHPDEKTSSKLTQMKELGYDYAEFALASIAGLNNEDFENFKKSLNDSNLKCEVCNIFLPGNSKLVGPDADHKSVIEYVTKAMARANELGVKIIVFGSGGARTYPEGFAYEAAKEQVIAFLKEVAPIAKENGVTIAIEPLSSKECNMINTTSEAYELVKEISHDSIKLLADFYHMNNEKEDYNVLKNYGDDLIHVHIASFARYVPSSETENEIVPMLKILEEINYNNRLSIEAGTENFYNALKSAHSLMTPYLK